MFPVVELPHGLDYHLFRPYHSHFDYGKTFKKDIKVVSVFWISDECAEFCDALLLPQKGSMEVKYYYC